MKRRKESHDLNFVLLFYLTVNGWVGLDLVQDSTYPVVFTMSCNRINFSEFCLGVMHCVILCRTWNWRGYSIRYQYAGSSGPALVLIHGFGANRSTYHILLLVNF